jgi:hypothetical protein
VAGVDDTFTGLDDRVAGPTIALTETANAYNRRRSPATRTPGSSRRSRSSTGPSAAGPSTTIRISPTARSGRSTRPTTTRSATRTASARSARGGGMTTPTRVPRPDRQERRDAPDRLRRRARAAHGRQPRHPGRLVHGRRHREGRARLPRAVAKGEGGADLMHADDGEGPLIGYPVESFIAPVDFTWGERRSPRGRQGRLVGHGRPLPGSGDLGRDRQGRARRVQRLGLRARGCSSDQQLTDMTITRVSLVDKGANARGSRC